MIKTNKFKNKKIKKLALIGLSVQSRSELTPAILKLKDKCEIVAICDLNDDFIAETLRLIPNADSVKVFKNYHRLFKKKKVGEIEIDGIIISVPHFLYADIVEKAVSSNIDVFKEKPLAFNLEEAENLSTFAFESNVQIYTVTKREFYPSYIMGLQLLQHGIIGTPYMYSARHFISHGNLYDGWRSKIESSGGGVLIDMGYHLLDVILRYFGNVNQVNLHWTNIGKPNHTYEVEDAASLLIWHTNSIHGVFQLAALSGPKEEVIEIRGTKGRIVVTKSLITTYDTYGKLINEHIFNTNSMEAIVKAFDQFLQNDKLIWSQNLSHNIKLMRVIDIAYKRRFPQ